MMRVLAFFAPFLIAAFIFSNCDATYKEGALIYKNQCASCHMDDGSGLIGLIPPLANSDYLKKPGINLPCLLKKGQKGPIIVNEKSYGMQEMSPMPLLSAVEITNVLNYVATHFGNQNPVLTLEDVKKKLADCE